jgi:hypothetical protein
MVQTPVNNVGIGAPIVRMRMHNALRATQAQLSTQVLMYAPVLPATMAQLPPMLVQHAQLIV